ncbi:ABC transporter permease [Homoserinimonas hongtaonis]|uniref:ABC transporter permease n=1 Tax=Homoserinimonas hongtaonis TaxID=2079791 RepID=A0A2U1SWZ2_9MICO|nr:ABC transporter permease [Salinibacterium hongtaonis]PWB96140.1 ABC transporter permease [Salinibacterium hongtaonis]
MVALFLQLRLSQLSHALRRPATQLCGLALIVALGIALTGYAVDAFGELRSATPGFAGVVGILVGSAIILLFWVVPLFTAVDDIADPRAFAVLGVRPSAIAGGLAASALLSVPSLLLVIVAVSYTVSWVTRPGTAVVAVLSGVLIVATGVLGGRVSKSLGSAIFSSRHLRELAGVLGVFAALATLPFVLSLLLGSLGVAGLPRLGEIAAVLAGSPLGFAWAAPVDAASGNQTAAWAKLLLAVIVVALLAIAWRATVSWVIRLRVPRDLSLASGGRGLGWFDVFAGTEVGAIAARSMTYWLRDPRYRLVLMIIPVVALLVLVPFLVIGVWWQNLALVPLPIICLFLGWALHNDLAHDSSALWLHVASNVSGWTDRVGRAIPVLFIGSLTIALLAPVSTALYSDWSVFPAMIGLSFCLLLSGIGISSYLSVRMPYAAVRPGASPFAQPQSSSGSGGQAVAFLLILVCAVPTLGLGALTLSEGGLWGMLTLLVGVVTGLLVLVCGLAAGARVFARQAPELLAFTLRN